MKTKVLSILASLILLPGIAQAVNEHPDHDKHKHDEHEHEEHSDHEHGHDEHREHGAHVHGEARLTLAVEGKTLEIMLESPADNLFGFEHAPETDAEKAHAENVLAQLKKPGELFSPDAAAECKASTPEVESPFKTGEGKAEHEGHADVDANYSFECQQPAKLNKIEFLLLKQFQSLRTLKVEYITDAKQGTQDMTSENIVLELK